VNYTEISEAPESYRRWVGFSIVAACLRRKCRLVWGLETFYPNLYIVLVGPSGARKGAAMRPGAALLDEVGVKKASEAITREALIRELGQSTDSYMVDGVPILHSSLTVFSQELTVFLGYNNLQLMSDLADWFDCSSKWTYRTKHQGTDEIIGVWLNLIGATTPELLQSALPKDAIGLGLTGRIIFVYEREKGKDVIFPVMTPEIMAIKNQLLNDMNEMNIMSGEFRVTDAFRERWAKWYPTCSTNPPFEDNRFGGYIQRRGTHIMKLSIVASAARTSSLEVDACDFDYALSVLLDAEVRMPVTFSGVGSSDIASLIPKVITFIAKKGEVDFGELMRAFYSDADRNTMERILGTVRSTGAIDIVFEGSRRVIRCLDDQIIKGMKAMNPGYVHNLNKGGK